ncbi:MAG: GxxExxY protein [Candidatus Hydrogenedentes bacterium]|nr:GxxExxY protein [Candidatus Hydrogenedentota bacterium]
MALILEKETYAIIGAAMEVHGILGPGYLEGVYHEAMEIELELRKIPYVSQPTMRIEFKGHILKKFYVPDFLIFDSVPVELKAHSTPISKPDLKQIINSLTCYGKRIRLLINFGCESLEAL